MNWRTREKGLNGDHKSQPPPPSTLEHQLAWLVWVPKHVPEWGPNASERLLHSSACYLLRKHVKVCMCTCVCAGVCACGTTSFKLPAVFDLTCLAAKGGGETPPVYTQLLTLLDQRLDERKVGASTSFHHSLQLKDQVLQNRERRVSKWQNTLKQYRKERERERQRQRQRERDRVIEKCVLENSINNPTTGFAIAHGSCWACSTNRQISVFEKINTWLQSSASKGELLTAWRNIQRAYGGQEDWQYYMH